MHNFAKLSLCLSIVAFAGCGPSIDAASQAQVNAWKQGLSAGAGSFASAGHAPRPFAVGQWAEYLEIDDKGQPVKLTYRIVGQEEDAFWMEVERLTYYGRSISQMLLTRPDWTNPDTWDIRGVVTQNNDDPPQRLPVMFTKSLMKPIITSLHYEVVEGAPTASTKTRAGTFEGAASITATVKSPFGTFETEGTAHAAIPITAMVKSSAKDGSYLTEIVAFGEEGAKSSITQRPKVLGY